MASLTRRRENGWQAQHWLIFADDIRIGSIGMRTGVPVHAEQWPWTVAAYPASHWGIRAGGVARSFPEARAAFERAWLEINPKITDADRMEHRRVRAHTEWKYRMWEAGFKLPTQVASGRSRCYCGAEIDIRSAPHHVYAEHMR